jgi:hypothetical protein
LALEFFRPDHGHQQINKQQQRDKADDDGFHLYSYSFSQSSVYSAPTIKNATTVPIKIKSLIFLRGLSAPHAFPFTKPHQERAHDEKDPNGNSRNDQSVHS